MPFNYYYQYGCKYVSSYRIFDEIVCRRIYMEMVWNTRSWPVIFRQEKFIFDQKIQTLCQYGLVDVSKVLNFF